MVPAELKSEVVAPLLCGECFVLFLPDDIYAETGSRAAGLTMYSAIAKARLQPGDWLVLPGAGGGLGHM